MSTPYEKPNYQWSAFHGTDSGAQARHQDNLDFYSACPGHDYQTWAGNPMIEKCTKCGDWHYKA